MLKRELRELLRDSNMPEFAYMGVLKEVLREQWRKEIRSHYDGMPLAFKANDKVTVENVEEMLNVLPDNIPQEVVLEEVGDIKWRGWKDILRGKLRSFPQSVLAEFLSTKEDSPILEQRLGAVEETQEEPSQQPATNQGERVPIAEAVELDYSSYSPKTSNDKTIQNEADKLHEEVGKAMQGEVPFGRGITKPSSTKRFQIKMA